MNLIQNKVNWEELIAKLRVMYPHLTESDVQYKPGSEKCLLRIIEYKLRKTKNEMLEILAEMGYFPSEKNYKLINNFK